MAPRRIVPCIGCFRLIGLTVLLLSTVHGHALQNAPPSIDPTERGFRFPADATLAEVTLLPRLKVLLETLRSPIWSVRDQAMRELASDAFPNEQLLAAMRQFDLDSEQRARLLTIMSRRILDAPSGAVGIRMSSGMGAQNGVQIEAVIEGMPAAGLLKAGDLVIQIDEQPVRRRTDLTAIVQSKLPGDLITVVLKRIRIDQNGEFLLDDTGEVRRELVEVRFALGSIDQLASDGGNVVRSSSVRSDRARLVQELLQRFAGEPVRIEAVSSAMQASEIAARSVDKHPAVIWLTSISVALEQGTLEMSANLRLQIFKRMDSITEPVSEEPVSDEQRMWLERVSERYFQIVEEISR